MEQLNDETRERLRLWGEAQSEEERQHLREKWRADYLRQMHEIEERHRKTRRRLFIAMISTISAIIVLGVIDVISVIQGWDTLHLLTLSALATVSIILGISTLKLWNEKRKSEFMSFPDYRRSTHMLLLSSGLNFFIAFMTIHGWDVLLK